MFTRPAATTINPKALATALLLASSLAQAQAPFSFAPAAPNSKSAGATQPVQFFIPEVFPAGRVTLKRTTDLMAPFQVTVPADGQSYFVKLVDTNTGKDTVFLYLATGSTKRIEVPLGTYELRYASGSAWFGQKNLFGPDTQRFKARTQLLFAVEKGAVSGHSVRLLKQRDGNLSTEPISEAAF